MLCAAPRPKRCRISLPSCTRPRARTCACGSSPSRHRRTLRRPFVLRSLATLRLAYSACLLCRGMGGTGTEAPAIGRQAGARRLVVPPMAALLRFASPVAGSRRQLPHRLASAIRMVGRPLRHRRRRCRLRQGGLRLRQAPRQRTRIGSMAPVYGHGHHHISLHADSAPWNEAHRPQRAANPGAAAALTRPVTVRATPCARLVGLRRSACTGRRQTPGRGHPLPRPTRRRDSRLDTRPAPTS